MEGDDGAPVSRAGTARIRKTCEMSKFSVQMSCDIEINDEDQAKALASEYVRFVTQQAEARGGTVTTDSGESAEVAIHRLIQDMNKTACAVVSAALLQGLQAYPWLGASKVLAVITPGSATDPDS
jgi:hypothetical protein